MQRLQLTQDHLSQALEAIIKRVGETLDVHGMNAYASPHEIMGLLEEEYELEFKFAVKENNTEQTVDELLDIAAVALKGVASMVAGAQYKEALEQKIEEFKKEKDVPSTEDAQAAAERTFNIMKNLKSPI